MRFLPLFFGLSCLISLVLGQTVSEPQPVSDAPIEEVSDYVRFLEGPDNDRLQTAITRFEKDGTIVDLVGVVHLGDDEYFENLNQVLSRYDVVLYEMVGGAFTPGAADELPTGSDEMAGIRQLQTMAKSFLGLEFQLDGIDYEANNFVHADVEWDGLNNLMTARNQNFSEIFTRAMALSAEGNIAGLPDSEAGMSLMLGGLLTAVTTGNSDELKRILAPLLSEAETFITQLEGDDGTVLVTERNKVVMKKLEEVQQTRTGGNYAIFYGAGHMPDLEERLVAQGFVQGNTSWVDAWLIEKRAKGEAPAIAAEPGDFFLNILQENPEIMESLQKMGEMLESIQPSE